jgi:hypothetical protein
MSSGLSLKQRQELGYVERQEATKGAAKFFSSQSGITLIIIVIIMAIVIPVLFLVQPFKSITDNFLSTCTRSTDSCNNCSGGVDSCTKSSNP